MPSANSFLSMQASTVKRVTVAGGRLNDAAGAVGGHRSIRRGERAERLHGDRAAAVAGGVALDFEAAARSGGAQVDAVDRTVGGDAAELKVVAADCGARYGQ